MNTTETVSFSADELFDMMKGSETQHNLSRQGIINEISMFGIEKVTTDYENHYSDESKQEFEYIIKRNRYLENNRSKVILDALSGVKLEFDFSKTVLSEVLGFSTVKIHSNGIDMNEYTRIDLEDDFYELENIVRELFDINNAFKSK